MERFWDLLQQSVILQGTITVGIIGAVVFLAVTGQEIPEIVEKLSILIVGFFMGSKAGVQVQSAVKQVLAQLQK